MPVWNATTLGRRLPKLEISPATLIAIAATIAFATVSLVALHLGNELLPRAYYRPDSLRIYLPLVAAIVAAAVFFNTRYQSFSNLLRACTRASAVGLLILLLVEAPDYSLGNPAAAPALDYIHYGYFAALLCAAAAIFRPSFIVPVAIYLSSTRLLVMPISGLEMSTLDIRYMLDMAMYLAIFGIFAAKVGPRLGGWFASAERQSEIVGVAMGLHLANYFWSGIAKMAAGPTPWYWIFENQTHNQIPYTLQSGILPIGHIPWLTQFSYDMMGIFNAPLNAAIVIAQVFAIICVLKVSWLKIASVLYDILHIGIYVFGGLFFWPWVWNNLTVWWAARSTGKAGLTLNTKVACMVTILLGAPALNLNQAAWLAWFDVSDARQIYFEAVEKDGTAVKVPSAFFLSHSYSVSHGYMGRQTIPGQYEATMLASTDLVTRNRLNGHCVDPDSLPREQRAETPEGRAKRQAELGAFLTNHHHKMLEREATLGRGSWYFHVHHHPSNPFLYDQFNSLHLNNVVGYRLVMESTCPTMKDGRVEKKVLQRDTEYYGVR